MQSAGGLNRNSHGRLTERLRAKSLAIEIQRQRTDPTYKAKRVVTLAEWQEILFKFLAYFFVYFCDIKESRCLAEEIFTPQYLVNEMKWRKCFKRKKEIR